MHQFVMHQALASSAANSCLIQNNIGDVTFNALADKLLVFAQLRWNSQNESMEQSTAIRLHWTSRGSK
jgi:hypothetical protein